MTLADAHGARAARSARRRSTRWRGARAISCRGAARWTQRSRYGTPEADRGAGARKFRPDRGARAGADAACAARLARLRAWTAREAGALAARVRRAPRQRIRARMPRRPAPGQHRLHRRPRGALRLHRIRSRAALDRRHERSRVRRHGPARARPAGAGVAPAQCLAGGERRLRGRRACCASTSSTARWCAPRSRACVRPRGGVRRATLALAESLCAARPARPGADARPVRIRQDRRSRRRCSSAWARCACAPTSSASACTASRRARERGAAPAAGIYDAASGAADLCAPGRACRGGPRSRLSCGRGCGIPASASERDAIPRARPGKPAPPA